MIVNLYRSQYRRPWYGIVLFQGVIGDPDIADFLLVRDARGRAMRSRKTMLLNVGWVRRVGTFDISTLNPDWLIGGMRKSAFWDAWGSQSKKAGS